MPHLSRRPLAALCAGLLFVVTPLYASHIGDEAVTDQQTVSSTDQLLNGLRQFENAPAAVRAARLQQLVTLAQARQERLLRLLDRNPRLATMRLLPAGLRERFPAAARPYLEQDVGLEGTLRGRIADDFARGVAVREFVFENVAGGALSRVDLAEADAERLLTGMAGQRVALRGVRIGNRLLVSSRSQLVALDATGTSTGTVVTTTPKITGAQKTLVILANFSDKTLSCTAADVQNRVFGSTGSTVTASFQESSRGLVSFNGTVAGPVSIPYSASGTCDYGAWASAADSAARAAGFDPSLYARVSYVTPSNANCGWSGLAYMPGKQSWIQSCGSTGVYTHELGHNLSLHHAATPAAEYGDGSDPMGGARNVRNNGANQAMAGWLPTGALVDVFNGGSYTIAALGGESSTQPQVMRVVKADTKEYYYVSMRQALGLDAGLPTTALNTLSVHRATGTLPTRTYLLANLAAGQTYTDSVNGIQFTHQGVVGSSATVGVTFSGATCARVAPTVTLSPASVSGTPGSSRSFSVAVTNNNSAACGTGSFTLASVLPTGFSGTLGATSLSIAPAASASTSWSVGAPTTATAGTYTLDLAATDTAATTSSTTAHASFIVDVDTAAPVIASVTPAAGAVVSGRSLAVSASVSDNIGVAAVEFWLNGNLVARDTSAPYAASVNLRKVPKGAATLRVRATDAAGNTSEATSSFTIQ